MNKKKRKMFLVLIVSVVVIALILTCIFIPKNYEKSYERDKVKVLEKYDKNLSVYSYELSYDGNEFYTIYEDKYTVSRKQIDKVSVFEDEDMNEVCLLPEGKRIENVPICIKDEELVDYDFLESDTSNFYERDKVKSVNDSFKNIDIKSTDLGNMLIWAHKGYYFISKEKTEEISFLDNEVYYNDLAYMTDEFLLTPDYDAEYTFNKFYLINAKTGKLTEWEFDFEINFNSYYLGAKDGIVYLFDRKESVEYAINPKKKDIKIVSKKGNGIVWNKGWDEVSVKRLANEDYIFTFDNIYNYEVLNSDSLVVRYLNSKENVLLSKKKDAKIIKGQTDTVYYLVKDTLYAYNSMYGEVVLLKYSEWEFNNVNSIYIY